MCVVKVTYCVSVGADRYHTRLVLSHLTAHVTGQTPIPPYMPSNQTTVKFI